MATKKPKDMVEIMKEVRTTWNINPRTRVQEDERKNKKKRRQNDKKQINESTDQDIDK